MKTFLFSESTTIHISSLEGHYGKSVSKARNLGTIIDRHLTMTIHVNNICRHASLALRNICRVRKYITQSSTERLVHAFITSKLDYCNILLYGRPSTEVQKLQRN